MNMSRTVCVWDFENKPPDTSGILFYWRSWDAPGGLSALALQAEHQQTIRSEFLLWVSKFGKTQINGKPLYEHFRFSDGFSAWWMSKIFERHPAVYGPGLYEFFKLRAFEIWAEENNIQRVKLFSVDKSLCSTLKKWCSRTGREFIVDGLQVSLESQRKTLRQFFIVRLILMFLFTIRWWFTERIKFPSKSKAVRKKGIAMAAWFPNIDEQAAIKGKFVSKYWLALHQLLDSCPLPVQWLFIPINARSDMAKNVQTRDGFTASGQETFTFWQECVTELDTLGAVADWIITILKARYVRKHYEAIFSWPASNLDASCHLKNVWEESFSDNHFLLMLLIRRGINRWAGIIGPQNVVFVPSEIQMWERMLYFALRKQGNITTCGNMHSMVGSGDFRFFLAEEDWENSEILQQMPDLFLCNGSAALHYMQQGGFPAERLKRVEAIRYPYFESPPATGQAAKVKRILVATTYYPYEVDAQIRILSEAVCCGLAKYVPEIIIKPHPAFPVEDYLVKYFEKQETPEINTSPLIELLTPGTMVYAGNSTTVAVEAAYQGLPLAIQEAIDDFNISPMGCIEGIQFIKTAEELLQVVQNPPVTNIPPDFFYLNDELPLWQELFDLILYTEQDS